jgi:hypothetical protein
MSTQWVEPIHELGNEQTILVPLTERDMAFIVWLILTMPKEIQTPLGLSGTKVLYVMNYFVQAFNTKREITLK